MRNETELYRALLYMLKVNDKPQELLNYLYPAVKDIPGSGIHPRFNAKVSDLIWVAFKVTVVKKKRIIWGMYELPYKIIAKQIPDPKHPKDCIIYVILKQETAYKTVIFNSVAVVTPLRNIC